MDINTPPILFDVEIPDPLMTREIRIEEEGLSALRTRLYFDE